MTPDQYKTELHTIRGGNGIRLNVETAGRPDRKPILFIHGFSQSRLVWRKQLESELAEQFFLVAMDLRGHGLSEKPRDSYGNAKEWADDLNNVITALNLRRPLLVGWSYAGIVISDYIEHYGEDGIAGTNWVGAVSRLGAPLVDSGFLGADFLSCVPGFFSENITDSAPVLERFVRLCVNGELEMEEFYLLLGCTVVVPPYVRSSLLAREVNNDAVITGMRKPALITWGDHDRIASELMRKHLEGLVRKEGRKVSNYRGSGHAPFWEYPERFNRELCDFRESLD